MAVQGEPIGGPRSIGQGFFANFLFPKKVGEKQAVNKKSLLAPGHIRTLPFAAGTPTGSAHHQGTHNTAPRALLAAGIYPA